MRDSLLQLETKHRQRPVCFCALPHILVISTAPIEDAKRGLGAINWACMLYCLCMPCRSPAGFHIVLAPSRCRMGSAKEVLQSVCLLQDQPPALQRVMPQESSAHCRVGSAKEVLSRGQEVWVKVLSNVGSKISLNMRDVDQATGEDLMPAAPARAAPAAGPQHSLRGLSGLAVKDDEPDLPSRRPG